MMHVRRSPEEIAANRARYEAHQKKGLEFTPKAFPPPSQLPAPALEQSHVIHTEIIPAGWYWSTRLVAGEAVRVSQSAGGGSVALIAWSASDPSERINLPDTVKVQWTTVIGKGRVIFSDMGRVMLSVVEDSSGAHDCLLGGSTATSNAEKYKGATTRNTRDNFILLAGKLGFQRRHIPAALSLFAPVRVDDEGAFRWRSDFLNGEDYVELRAEMDLLVGFSNCPHPLDPAPQYAAEPVTITRFRSPEPTEDDFCRTATPEAVRGFENNACARA